MSVASALLCCCEPGGCPGCSATALLVETTMHVRFEAACWCPVFPSPATIDFTVDDPSIVVEFVGIEDEHCVWEGQQSYEQSYASYCGGSYGPWSMRVTAHARLERSNALSETIVKVWFEASDIGMIGGGNPDTKEFLRIEGTFSESECPNGGYTLDVVNAETPIPFTCTFGLAVPFVPFGVGQMSELTYSTDMVVS